jgi:DNA mismatch repair ATPase MutS
MMQCGMFVPAELFSANVCNGLFTHFKRKEDASMKSGKLEEELIRIGNIADKLKPGSVVLFNESFSTTNEREGSELSRQIIKAMFEKRIKIFFVTHLYEFAHASYQNSNQNTIFLRAERQSDGTRTFKLIPGEPLQTSYGQDLYHRIFENIIVP